MEESKPKTTEDSVKFPGYTLYKPETFMKCVNLNYIGLIQKYFWGQWEVNIAAPSFVILASSISTIMYMVFTIAHPDAISISACPLLLCLQIAFQIPYIKTIETGPGYFPFYWQSDMTEDPSIDSTPAGVISDENQYWYAKAHRTPPRSVLARSARRFVARPDHLCGWTATWIGKKNMKFFILFNFYGVFFLACLFGFCLRLLLFFFKSSSQILLVLSVMVVISSLSFLCLTLIFFTQSFINACMGITSWEKWNNINLPRFEKTAAENLREVFGKEAVWKWLLPMDPFPGVSISELMRGEPNYYDEP